MPDPSSGPGTPDPREKPGGTPENLPTPGDAQRIRDLLVENGYDAKDLTERFGLVKPPLPEFGLRTRLLDATREPNRENLLLRLFFLSHPVGRHEARAALPPWFLEASLATGLLAEHGDDLVPTCILAPHEDLLIASDPYARLRSPGQFDHVLSVNPSALHLVNFTIRRQSHATLDLCTGSGIQALMASSHSGTVVATDLNPRAVYYAELNARLNGRDNIETLTGDTFAPVEGREFNLIVCNPPFVLAPSKRFLWRDNDLELDEFCRRLVRRAPGHLAEGGYFQMICEWPQTGGQDWKDRIAEWFEGTGCDIWALKGTTQSPSAYAASRVQETLPASDEEATALFESWMNFYRQAGIETIHAGMIAMRRRSGRNWTRMDTSPGVCAGPFGEFVLQSFATQDFLEAHPDDETLLATRVRLSPNARLDLGFRPDAGDWQTISARIRMEDGLAHRIGVESEVASFVARLDGERTLVEIMGAPGAGGPLSTDPARAKCLKTVRFLLERGFLLVPPGS